MLYNGAQLSSIGVTTNMLFLGWEVVLQTDLFQGAPPLGPDNGTPNKIVDQMLRQAQQYKLVAGQNQLKEICMNTTHYLNIVWTFEPGDLVFAFSESRGGQVPHWKLRIKWSGPCVFIRRINSQMTEISTLPSEKEQYKAKNFVIHFRKLRLHQRQGDQQPHADPNKYRSFHQKSKHWPRTMRTAWCSSPPSSMWGTAKTISPPDHTEYTPGPRRAGGAGGGGGRVQPSPLKTLAGRQTKFSPERTSTRQISHWSPGPVSASTSSSGTPCRRKESHTPFTLSRRRNQHIYIYGICISHVIYIYILNVHDILWICYKLVA